MSVYSGFSTRKREYEYNLCLDQILNVLVTRSIKSVLGEQIDEPKFKKNFKNLFNSLVKLEDHKYMDPKFSETLAPLAISLKIKIIHVAEPILKDSKQDTQQSGQIGKSPEEKSIVQERESRTSFNFRPNSVGIRVKSQMRSKKKIDLPTNFVLDDQSTIAASGTTELHQAHLISARASTLNPTSNIIIPIKKSKSKQKTQQIQQINGFLEGGKKEPTSQKDNQQGLFLTKIRKNLEFDSINSQSLKSSQNRYSDTLNDSNNAKIKLQSNSPTRIRLSVREENSESSSTELKDISRTFDVKQQSFQNNQNSINPLGYSLQLKTNNLRIQKLRRRSIEQQQQQQQTYQSIPTHFSPNQKRGEQFDQSMDGDLLETSNSFWKPQKSPSPMLYSAFYMETSSIRNFHKTSDKFTNQQKKNQYIEQGLEKEPLKPKQSRVFSKE